MPITVTFKGKSMKAIRADLLRSIQQEIPRKVKIMALEHYNNSFQLQGFTDQSFQPWRPRKDEKRAVFLGKRVKYKGKKDGRANRAILFGKGRSVLAKSLRGRIAGKAVFISTDVIYAQIHNDGGLAGRNHSARIPRRRFIGESRMLNKELEHMITVEMKNALSKT